VDMNDLLSGLGNTRNNSSCNTKGCDCHNSGIGGIGGNNSIIWIIILLCFCYGGFGQAKGVGTVCACKKKHCKEYCRCGTGVGSGFGLGSCFGTGCGTGIGSGFGCWWIIILVFLFACGNKQSKGCTNNIINLDNCDEE
jgi:hypothetical protein